MNIIDLQSNEQFDDLLKSNKNLLIQFSATWCNPCKMVSTHMPSTQEILKDLVQIVKVDVDSFKEIATDYQIRSVPSFIYLKNGEVAHMSTGIKTQNDIVTEAQSVF